MSKRVTVCFDGRKILTKITEGESVQHLLDQINAKHNKAFTHVWLSESKAEGEIDDLDVVDNGEAIYLTGIYYFRMIITTIMYPLCVCVLKY